MKVNKDDIKSTLKENIDSFNEDLKYVYYAHSCLLKKLFGFVPEVPSDYTVSRRAYKKAMKGVQKEFNLEEGDPRFLLFIFEQLSRSPRFNDHPIKNKYSNK